MPGQSVESVEVLANPFAAEYGRFSTSITQIRTRRGTNEWEFKPGNLMPRLRGVVKGVRGFEPRFSIRGPLKQDRAFLAQDFQFRYVATPVRSLPDEPEIELKSFDSFTRIDTVLSSRHTLGGGLIAFPREIDRTTMNTFRPPETTPEFHQKGFSTGLVDRFAIAPDLILETTLSGRYFEIDVNGDGQTPMIYAPETQSGTYFNDHEREVGGLQWVEALTMSPDQWRGQHVFKLGVDLQRSSFDGFSESRPLEVRRLDGSLAELTAFGGRRLQQVSGVEFGAFAQDRWRVSPRVTFELGLRFDKDQIIDNINWSPRAGVAVAVLPEGRGILRGGFGKFVQRTPLNIDAFSSFESRVVTRFAADGAMLGTPVTYINVSDARLRTPEALVGNVEWNQRFGRRFLVKLDYLQRQGSHEYIVSPDASRGELRLSSDGMSRYKELEATARYLGGQRRDLTVSYVWSRGRADLNNYDQFFGNVRNPIVRPNEHNLIATDVPHRGPRNQSGRLPRVTTFDFAITRPWRFRKYQFRAGIRMFNAFGADAHRDVQSNITSPNYGMSFNRIERSFGVTFGAVR
ncbi:MAG: TonB-dependent receptor [Acidobacteria bacterium]|nr:TonB-dependent receptor [Acidobacteriota bacterium]